MYKLVCVNLTFGVVMGWTIIPSRRGHRGGRNTPSRFVPQEAL